MEFDLKSELWNVLTIFGFVAQIILNDNSLLELVNINNIYKTLYEILKSRFLYILNEKENIDTPKFSQGEGINEKIRKKEKYKTEESETADWGVEISKADEEKTKALMLSKEIKWKFEQIYNSEKKKKERFSINTLRCLKHAVGGCIYFYSKVSNKRISLRNILNSVDYNLFLLNTHNVVIAHPLKNVKEQIASTINIYDTIHKENICIDKEESFKMENIALLTCDLKSCTNIKAYSLLYELLFIMKTPYIINKFIYSVFNDVTCIPFIHQNFNDVAVVITCILFVNHFFYFLYKKKNNNPQSALAIKKIYMEQVQKIMKLFLYLHQSNQKVEMNNILIIFSKIIRLYSVKY